MEYAPPIHASAFVYKGMGCLIIGEPGSGKSRLLVDALLHGARLIADDRVRLCGLSGNLVASPVPQLEGVIELRGLGLIKRSDVAHSHPIHLVLILDSTATVARLPEPKTHELMGIKVPALTLSPAAITQAGSLLLYLEAMHDNRILPTDWRP